MKYLNVTPLIGALVALGVVRTQLAMASEPPEIADNRGLPVTNNTIPVINKIVGDFEPLSVPGWFLPNHMCVVDSKLSVLQQLQECKKQRKGWRTL